MSYGSNRYGISGLGSYTGSGSGLYSSSSPYSSHSSAGSSYSGLGSSGIGSTYGSGSVYGSGSLHGSGYGSSGLGSSGSGLGLTSSGYASGLGTSGYGSGGSGFGSRSSSTSSLPTSTYYGGISSLGNSSRLGRYSVSDVPVDSSRPAASRLAAYSRSTTNLDEYRKMYQEEKEENGKLRKELDRCKKDMLEAKAELDKLMKHDTSRPVDSTDKREKRALERKVSEYEEELKKMEDMKQTIKTLMEDKLRLKDEVGSLIRVITKLSK